MKTTFDIDDINIIIKSYNPDIITIDKYSSGLRRLLLFLYSKKNKEVLYIVFLGSRFILVGKTLVYLYHIMKISKKLF